MARTVAEMSKDPSTKVGAVIVDAKKRIVSTGYNGFARGIADTDERLNDREMKYKLVIHAERNAMIFAKWDLAHCTIYTFPLAPCAPCASLMIQSGIIRVVFPFIHKGYGYLKHPRWGEESTLAKEIFEEAGVAIYPISYMWYY